MSTHVVAVGEDTSIHDAKKIMEAHNIRRLPVMKKNQLVGLVTERMLFKAFPSPATALGINEMSSLANKTTIKDIMVKDPSTISPDVPPEEALQLGQEMGYGAFPVVENERLIGIVTESDIVRLMTRILGGKRESKRITMRTSQEFGTMQKIMKILDNNRTVLLSLVTLPPEHGEDTWLIVLRVKSEDAEPIAAELTSSGFTVAYVG